MAAAIIVVLLAFLTGCAMHSYTPTTTAATREIAIRPGDKVLVVTTRRERLSLRITEVRSDRFVGVTSGRFPEVTTDPFGGLASRPSPRDLRPDGETVEVPYDELAVVQVKRFDAALATVVVAVTVTAAAAVIHLPPPVPLPAAP